MTHVTARLRKADEPDGSFEAGFLVDTGATDCLAPGNELRRIGIRPRGRKAYEFADGSLHQLEYGYAEVEFLGAATVSCVVFGADDAEPLLGVTALESAGFAVDPVTQTLRRLPAVSLK